MVMLAFNVYLSHKFVYSQKYWQEIIFVNTVFFWSLSYNFKNRLSASSCLSIHVEGLGSRWMDIHEILYLNIFFENLLRTFKFHLNRTGRPGTLCKDICVFMIIPR